MAKAKSLNRERRFRKKKKTISKEPRLKKGVVYLSHIPHGFYEDQIEAYFSQFGKVTAVSVPRSKTGRIKGYAFIEFRHCAVAEIAAETMNNYLMFNRLLKAKYIPPEEQKPQYFLIAKAARDNHRTAADKAALALKHNRRLKNRHLKIGLETKYAAKLLRKKEALKKQMKNLGLSYDFEVDEANVQSVLEKKVKAFEKKGKEESSSIELTESDDENSLFSGESEDLSLSGSIDSVSESEESFDTIMSKAKKAASDILKQSPKPTEKSSKIKAVKKNEITAVPDMSSKPKHLNKNKTPTRKKPLSVKKSESALSIPKTKKLSKKVPVMEVDESDEEISFKTPPDVIKKALVRSTTEKCSTKNENVLKDEKTSMLTKVTSSKSHKGKKLRHRKLKQIYKNKSTSLLSMG